jgi:hypothetical protein
VRLVPLEQLARKARKVCAEIPAHKDYKEFKALSA